MEGYRERRVRKTAFIAIKVRQYSDNFLCQTAGCGHRMSGVTALGCDFDTIAENMKKGITGVRFMDEWQDIEGLNTRLGAPVPAFEIPPRFKRKQLRGAGRVSKLALSATDKALIDAGLLDNDIIASGATGVAYGSSTGSVDAVQEFGAVLISRTTHSLNSTSYVRMMPHTSAVNISVVYKSKGRIIPTSCACTFWVVWQLAMPTRQSNTATSN